MARREVPPDATELLLLSDARYLLKGEAAGAEGGAPDAATLVASATNADRPRADASDSSYARALGRFGPWQLRTLLLVALVKAPSAWQMAAILFTSPSPAHEQYWCKRPPEAQQRGAREWRNYSHVALGPQFDSCNIYKEAYEMLMSGELPQFDRNNATIEPCKQFEFNSSVTAVTQWNLVCEREVLITISQFFYLCGILVGGAVCTKLLLKIPPRKLLLSGMLVQIAAGIGVAFSTFIEMQMFLRFITAAACAHMFTAGFAICTGNADGRARLIIGSCYEHFWSLGVITLHCLASLFEDWRHLQLAISIPTILLLVFYCWIPESPLWLLNAGKNEEAKDILDKVLYYNDEVHPIMETVSRPDVIRNSIVPEPPKYDLNIYCYTALHVAWAGTVVTYYGALLNVKNIGDHLFINTGIAGIAEIIGVLLSLGCMVQSSSKWTTLGIGNIFGGSLCFLAWVLPTQDAEVRAWSMLTIAMVARVTIAASLNMLTVISAELLPKNRRQNIMFSAVTIARICLLSAPFIGTLAKYGDIVPLSVFGAFTMITGFATIPLQKVDNLKDFENNNYNASIKIFYRNQRR